MSIIPDPILALLQVLPFLVLMLGLHFILFKPMLAYLEARDHATVGARHDAQALAAKAEAKLRDYEQALEKARNEVAEYRAARRAEAQKVYMTRVAAAREASDKRLGGAMATITTEAREARSQMGGRARALAVEAASQVLGRPVNQVEA